MSRYWCVTCFLLVVQDQKQKPDTDFVPNLVNTVCFVVNFIIQLSTFVVNYQGAPFNTPIKETKGFFNMLKWSYIFCLAITWNALGIGTAFSLVWLFYFPLCFIWSLLNDLVACTNWLHAQTGCMHSLLDLQHRQVLSLSRCHGGGQRICVAAGCRGKVQCQ